MGGEASVFGFEILPRPSERLHIQQPGWSIAHRQGWVYVISRQGSQNGNSCVHEPLHNFRSLYSLEKQDGHRAMAALCVEAS